jgi:hypothetical protein
MQRKEGVTPFEINQVAPAALQESNANPVRAANFNLSYTPKQQCRQNSLTPQDFRKE